MTVSETEKKIRVVGRDYLFGDDRHILVCASSGSGKTVFLENLAQARWAAGFKIVCVTLKSELVTFGFPETSRPLVSRLAEFNRLPRAFPSEVLVPFARSRFSQDDGAKMELQLPRHTLEFVDFQKQQAKEGRAYGWSCHVPFKFPFSKLRAPDLLTLIPGTTDSGAIGLDLIFKTQRFKSLGEIIGTLVRLSSKNKAEGQKLVLSASSSPGLESEIGNSNSFLGLLRLLVNLEKSGFICSDGSEFALDLDAMMSDRKTISSLDLGGLDPAFGFLVFVSFMRQVLELRNQKAYPKLLLVIPELGNFAPSSPSVSPFAVSSSGVSALSILQTISRESRLLGITLLADAQRPQDVDSVTRNNFGWLVVGSTQLRNVDWVCENLCPLPETVVGKLSSLQIGVFLVQNLSSSQYAYPFKSAPSQSHHRQAGEDVSAWIASQPFVEQVTYTDNVSESLRVEVRRPIKTAPAEKVTPTLVPLTKAIQRLRKEGQSGDFALSNLIRFAGLPEGTNAARYAARLKAEEKKLGVELHLKAKKWVISFGSTNPRDKENTNNQDSAAPEEAQGVVNNN